MTSWRAASHHAAPCTPRHATAQRGRSAYERSRAARQALQREVLLVRRALEDGSAAGTGQRERGPEPSPGADVAAVSPVPAQMWQRCQVAYAELSRYDEALVCYELAITFNPR